MSCRGGLFVRVGLAAVVVALTSGCAGTSGTRAAIDNDPMHTSLADARQSARPGQVRQRGASDALGRAVFPDRPPAATAIASADER